jgi:hypothetical protein
MATVLYLSYDGLMEPLGQSQVWQYLSGLSENHHIFLISFEKRADWENESERARIKAAVAAKGVTWKPLRYHKRPSALATAFDIAQGVVRGCMGSHTPPHSHRPCPQLCAFGHRPRAEKAIPAEIHF